MKWLSNLLEIEMYNVVCMASTWSLGLLSWQDYLRPRLQTYSKRKRDSAPALETAVRLPEFAWIAAAWNVAETDFVNVPESRSLSTVPLLLSEQCSSL